MTTELEINSNQMDEYYKTNGNKSFPFELIYSLFVRSDRREVTFWKGTSPIRYKSIKSGIEFRSIAKSTHGLTGIDVGAFYDDVSLPPKERIPIGRELVFDIDLNDYNRVFCDCSKQKTCCKLCWIYIDCAIDVICYLMRQIGITQDKILVFFSGRRGAHFWILDEKLFHYTEQQRINLLRFLNLENTPENIVNDVFEICWKYYNILISYENGVKFAKIAINSESIDTQRRDILGLFKPHFDKNVTTSMNHLIKIPMSMHSSTKVVMQLIDKNTKSKLSFEEAIEILKYIDKNRKLHFKVLEFK